MSGNRNKHNLPRDIPEPKKRIVRKECAFACVICGRLYRDYDHFDPPYEDAVSHEPAGIALLCAEHHAAKRGKRPSLTNEKIKLARLRAKERFRDVRWAPSFGGPEVALRLGKGMIRGASVGLHIGPHRLIKIHGTDDPLTPWLLSGAFHDGATCYVKFEKSEVIASTDNWDVEFVGSVLTIRSALGRTVLQLGFEDDALAILALDLVWPSGFRIALNSAGGLCFENLGEASLQASGTGAGDARWHFTGRVVVDDLLISEDPKARSAPQAAIAIAGHTNLSIGRAVVEVGRGMADLNLLFDFAPVFHLLETPEVRSLVQDLRRVTDATVLGLRFYELLKMFVRPDCGGPETACQCATDFLRSARTTVSMLGADPAVNQFFDSVDQQPLHDAVAILALLEGLAGGPATVVIGGAAAAAEKISAEDASRTLLLDPSDSTFHVGASRISLAAVAEALSWVRDFSYLLVGRVG